MRAGGQDRHPAADGAARGHQQRREVLQVIGGDGLDDRLVAADDLVIVFDVVQVGAGDQQHALIASLLVARMVSARAAARRWATAGSSALIMMGTRRNSPSWRWRKGNWISSECSASRCTRLQGEACIQVGDERLVQGHTAQGGLVGILGVHSIVAHPGAVAGSHEHDRVHPLALELVVGIGGRLARIGIASMGADEAQQITRLRGVESHWRGTRPRCGPGLALLPGYQLSGNAVNGERILCDLACSQASPPYATIITETKGRVKSAVLKG